jgi:hypothetical protein
MNTMEDLNTVWNLITAPAIGKNITEWLESEHNVVLNGNSLAFVSKNDALMFMVKWL